MATRRAACLAMMAVVIMPQVALWATPSNRQLFYNRYPDSPLSAQKYRNSETSCNICHYYGFGPEVNPFGADFRDNEGDFDLIEPLDSDTDGAQNVAEIASGEHPGVSQELLARWIVGDREALLQPVNANGDKGQGFTEIIDAADLAFHFTAD